MKRLIALAALVVLGMPPAALAQQAVPFAGDRVVRIMTRNVYHGVNAELAAAGAATSFADFLSKTAAVYQGYHARNFPERAAALAAEIDATRPELVGLQEAVLVRTQFPADGPRTPATTVDLDFVQILLDALAARGLHYEVAAQAVGWDIEVPTALGFDLRHTDREVILARADLSTADLKVSNAQGGNFTANCGIPTRLLGNLTIRRSWVAVDVKVRGKQFRLISTHLDGDCFFNPPFTPVYQRAQVAELLAGPAVTDLPLVLIGDLNSPGDGSGITYNDVMAAGFSDVWTLAGSGPDFTCCQANDLLNPVSALYMRIDFVLFRGDFTALAADVVGDDPTEMTPSGLWPADHAGVVGVLQLPQP